MTVHVNVAVAVTVAVAVAAAVSVAGCSDTAVVLTLTTDRPLDGFCLAVDADGAERFSQRYSAAASPLPQTLTVFPGAHPHATARAYALVDAQEVSFAAAALSFPSGKVNRATLALDRCPLAAGTAAFAPPAPGPVAGPGARALLVDGPAGAQALVLDGANASRLVATASGLQPAAAPPAPPPGAAPPIAADLDGDCLAELVIPGDGGATLWRADAQGGYRNDLAALPAGPPALAAAAGDLDGDGAADLVLCGGPSLRVLHNDGRGRFTDVAAAVSEPAGDKVSDATACVLADFDGDGHLDLAVGQGAAMPAPDRIYLNDAKGTGHLTFAPGALPPLAERTAALAAADVDLDGRVDLLAAHLGAPVRLYLNRGGADLEDRSFGNLPDAVAADVPSLLAADLDGDCAPDLVVPRAGGAPRLWRNDGSGRFTDGGPLPAKESALAAARDVDGDGRLDLLLSGGPQGLGLLVQQ